MMDTVVETVDTRLKMGSKHIALPKQAGNVLAMVPALSVPWYLRQVMVECARAMLGGLEETAIYPFFMGVTRNAPTMVAAEKTANATMVSLARHV